MALTPEQIDTAYRKVWSTVPHAQRLSAFALEIEAEVRKEYTELIRKMLDALENFQQLGDFTPAVAVFAINAARARLGEKT